VSHEEEFYREGEMKGLKTGVWRFKLRVPKDKLHLLDELAGVKKYRDTRYIVQQLGQTGCFVCKKSTTRKPTVKF
jgi:hypothetical protein